MADKSHYAFWDMSWLAVPTTEQGDLLANLALSDAITVTWQQGIAAVCGDFWDFDTSLGAPLSRIFLPPPIRGWQLAIGGWFGGIAEDKTLEGVARLCRDLSGRYGQAHAFTTQGRMDFFAWILAHHGTVTRHFVWDDGVVVDRGTPVAAERARTAATTPSEVLVAAIAREMSVDPLALPAQEADRVPGLLATTAWGRIHGVPDRPLE